MDKLASTRENLDIKAIVKSVEEEEKKIQSLTTNFANVEGIRDQKFSLRTEIAPRTAKDVVTIKTTKTIEYKIQRKSNMMDYG